MLKYWLHKTPLTHAVIINISFANYAGTKIVLFQRFFGCSNDLLFLDKNLLTNTYKSSLAPVFS